MVGMSLIDKLGRKTLLLIGAAGCASCLAGVAWIFAHQLASGRAAVAAGDVHRVLLRLAGRGHLGLHRRSVSHLGALQGPGRGQRQPLVHEHAHRARCFPWWCTMMSTATPFVFFAVMTVVQFLVVLFVYPETKGQTLEAVAAQADAGVRSTPPLSYPDVYGRRQRCAAAHRAWPARCSRWLCSEGA